MRTVGIYLAVAGGAIIVLYALYQVLAAIVSISFPIQVGLILLIAGGVIVFISIIRERAQDTKREKFRGTKQ